MQHCVVYLHGGSIYIVSNSADEFGIYLSIGPMFKVGCDDVRQIGIAIVSALDASRSDVPRPADFKAFQKELYRFLNVKSWRELIRKALCVGVDRKGSRISITRYRVGEASSFMPDGPGTECMNCDPAHIGQSLLKAIGWEKSEAADM